MRNCDTVCSSTKILNPLHGFPTGPPRPLLHRILPNSIGGSLMTSSSERSSETGMMGYSFTMNDDSVRLFGIACPMVIEMCPFCPATGRDFAPDAQSLRTCALDGAHIFASKPIHWYRSTRRGESGIR